MKILWINPSFLDYRIPVYHELFKYTNGKFYILYSKNRVPDRINKKISNKIGSNAIAFEGEKRLIFGKPGMANKCISFPLVRGLYQRIKEIKPDMIIAEGFFQWTPFAVKYSIINKIPILISYERTKHTERNCPKWRTFYRKVIDKFVDAYLCNGLQTKEYLQSIGIKQNKCKIGGMSADSEGLVSNISLLSDDLKEKLKNELNLDREGLTYLYVGRLIPLKGVELLLKNWKSHHSKYIHDNLIIVGDGILYSSFLENYNGNDNIKIVGGIDYDNIYLYYAISDIFVIPTLEDNWSLVVPEAMSCGLAIACSKYNGCFPELVHKDVNGIVFDPLNNNSIIDSLQYFHNINIDFFKESSIKIEKDYNYKKVSERIFKVCNEIYEQK